MIKMFLDDIRPCPEGWVLVKTAREAIELLKTGQVIEASLDHDLGECEMCEGSHNPWCSCECHWNGYTVMKWIEENNMWPKEGIWLHSNNPVGLANMQAVIDRHERILRETE